MMWCPPQPVVTAKHFYCPQHDVYGLDCGSGCWVNGCAAKLDYGKWALGWSGSHHHDLSKRHVTVGNGTVPIRRELKRLV